MLFKKNVFQNEHDPLCIGTIAWGSCDCEMIRRIREDERERIPSCDDAYARGYLDGRNDSAKAVKRHLKKFKKSFRKSVAEAARGNN